jgi:DMSO/TMAO reductase YedYZ molybdopterin-dependent catalytic subunit
LSHRVRWLDRQPIAQTAADANGAEIILQTGLSSAPPEHFLAIGERVLQCILKEFAGLCIAVRYKFLNMSSAENREGAMSKTTDRGLFELYDDDPERADALVFGRTPERDRRGFLKGAGLATMGAMVGAAIPFHRNMPAGFIPIALAAEPEIKGKEGLRIVNDKPINAETLPHLLDDAITPTVRHFIRNNGHPPADVDAAKWTITIDGEVNKQLKLTIADLKKSFPVVTEALVIECAGNGRSFFDPPVSGGQWTYGAVGCSRWTGVRLADVLKAAGVKSSAVYTGHEGADLHLSGDPKKVTLSRGLPIAKAMNPHTLIAFEQNGGPLHEQNGAPVRLVAPGYPGSCSQKWLTRVWVRDKVHDGEKMMGSSYRVPGHPVAPGEKVASKDFVIIEVMPVKSLITSPVSRSKPASREIEVRGHAWDGSGDVAELAVSFDFGQTWQKAELDKPVNPFAWQNWRTKVKLPQAGYYEIWARATNRKGVSQPHTVVWNPRGYVNNAMHRVAVTVA